MVTEQTESVWRRRCRRSPPPNAARDSGRSANVSAAEREAGRSSVGSRDSYRPRSIMARGLLCGRTLWTAFHTRLPNKQTQLTLLHTPTQHTQTQSKADFTTSLEHCPLETIFHIIKPFLFHEMGNHMTRSCATHVDLSLVVTPAFRPHALHEPWPWPPLRHLTVLTPDAPPPRLAGQVGLH